jgi:hypothetical protein
MQELFLSQRVGIDSACFQSDAGVNLLDSGKLGFLFRNLSATP